MMNDKNGKAIKVGDVIRTLDGRKVRVAGLLQSRFTLIKAADCEVTDAFIGGKDNGDEEASLVWGN